MKYWAVTLLGCTLFVAAASAAPLVSAADPAPAPTPVAMTKPDFSSVNFLIGTWSCTQQLRGKTRPETDVTSLGMNGMWLVTQTTAPPFDQYRTATLNGVNYTGYDPTTKMWIQTGVDDGGGYGTQTSPGWQGSALTWTGKYLDGSSSTDLITKVSDTKYTDANSVTDPQGKTTNVMITCMKS
ncbi:MAG TPA: hypothetical protein VGK84_07725 [Candidatus Tumulicola sp.]|jgi:hypothetical protein